MWLVCPRLTDLYKATMWGNKLTIYVKFVDVIKIIQLSECLYKENVT